MADPSPLPARGGIRWLGNSECHDTLQVGAKAAHLSRLARIYRVPPGFCLAADAFVQAAVPGSGPDGLPAALQAAITESYARLAGTDSSDGQLPRVAVRSSAIDEDGPSASFAGQHATYLNISGAEAVIEAIGRCYLSAWSEQALAYRRQHGLAVDGVRLAVLVQQLVPADVSAVMFSAHPITGSRDELVITASWGLGESIVGGTVTPDSWVVRKDGLEIIDHRLGSKERMTVAVPGGAHEVDTPRLFRGQRSLSDEQVLEMARLGLSLEMLMGWPVDVECAYAGDELYLLQCRPVTTLRTAADGSSAAAIQKPSLVT
ncbi:MAG: PEP/pyruvate-binding domain-containing protein [Vicinamibacterales bacterium]